MRNSGHFWILLFIFIGFVGCSILPDELKRAESLIETAPDSALIILKHLSPDKYKSDADRALYGLLMIKALDKKMLPLKPVSLLDNSLAYYQSHPVDNRLAACYFYKAHTYKYTLQYEKAMNFYLKALDAVENKKDYTLLGKINFDMGDIYNIQRDYILARQKFHNAHAYFLQANSQLLAFYSLLYIGRTFHAAKEYKKAQIFYQNNIIQAKDSIQQGAMYQEIGLNFYDSKRLDSA
jgi:tetratricopeptide (TPR) repeat protein